jgi:putative ABC transport system permease protein
MALFICSIGLLGLALLTSQRRTRETGLRKVHGASIWQLVLILEFDLLKWIFISFIIAFPVAYIAMQKWLGNFAYRVSTSWWIFLCAGLITVVIASLTISIRMWNTARSNPADTLRYE